MKCTAIIPNDVADSFLNGTPYMEGVLHRSTADAWAFLERTATEYPAHGIKVKIGNGSFRDRVELNQKIRNQVSPTMDTGKRKGYYLITFQF